jgi:DNA-binding SARP family transcriptional activator
LEFNYSRLIGSLSSDLMSGGDLDDQFSPLLSGVCRNIGARSGLIAVHDADELRVVANYGVERPDAQALRAAAPPAQLLLHETWEAWPQARLVLPLSHEGATLGLLALGPRRADQPYGSNDLRLLRAVASYLVVVVAHQRVREQEQRAVTQLAEQGRVLREQQERLARLADEAVDRMTGEAGADAAPSDGLRVYCLGPLRVERDGVPIERWGGDKAGTYQAEALFAFLFDRRQRGLTKDEAAEVIWPELEIKKADTAFHRTLSALRRTLEPELRRGNESRAVPYHHDRYWLDPSLVAWCDVDAFEQRVAQGLRLRSQGDHQAARAALDEALTLYRGPYMDSSPFFGDSVYVEERRSAVEGLYVEAQLALAALLEHEGRTGEALRHYRQALQASGGEHARAAEAIGRLSR